MVTTVAAFEAKTHLSSLLDRAAKGEEIVITRHGRAIARLVGIKQADRDQAAEAVAKLKALRKRTTLGGIGWRELRDAGRR